MNKRVMAVVMVIAVLLAYVFTFLYMFTRPKPEAPEAQEIPIVYDAPAEG